MADVMSGAVDAKSVSLFEKPRRCRASGAAF
jgi:hypothetical protein